MTNLRKKTVSGLKWSAIERLITHLAQLLITLYLARLLGPDVFGLIGMVAVFLAISQVFIDSGMTSALIRTLDRTEQDFATAFQINIFISLICYMLLFMCRKHIANFYSQPELEYIIPVISTVVIFNALSVVQRAKLTIAMNFKLLAKSSIISVSISSFVSIALAVSGFGVWSLVGQIITMSVCNALLLNFFNPWIPSLSFCKDSFSKLFGFGSKLLVASLIDTLYQNIYQLIIGKQFSAMEVGFFTQANQLIKTPVLTFTAVIQRVTYPMLSKIQDDDSKLTHAYLLTLKLSALFIFPLIIGLGSVSDLLVPIILGDIWSESSIMLAILSFGLVLYPVHSINLNYLQVKGRSDLFLKLEVIKKIIVTLILFLTVPFGVVAICIGITIQSYISLMINSYYTGKLGALGIRKQLGSLAPIWIASLVCCMLSRVVSQLLFDSDWSILLFSVVMSVFLYSTYLFFFQVDLCKLVFKVNKLN